MSKWDDIKFMHIRETDDFGDCETNGGITVAYRIDLPSNTIQYARSRVHPNDRYVKEVGRQLAASRLVTNSPLQRTVSQAAINRALSSVINETSLKKIQVTDLTYQAIEGLVYTSALSDHVNEITGRKQNENTGSD